MKNRKFKVGDRVIFLDGSNLKHGNCMVPQMKQYVGKSGAIAEVATCHESWCSYAVKGGGGYWWPDTFLKKVPETIVIYRKDDKTVVAVDKSAGKEAVAKCNPEDEFDFNVGAKIAFERLVGGDKKEDKKEDSAIKVGDIVRISNPGKMYTTNYIWVRDNITDKTLIAKYAYGRSFYRNPDGGEAGPFKVLVIRDGKAYIQKTSLYGGACFLVGIDGLEKI